MLFCNSLIDGFLGSNFMGQGIVLAQLAASVVMFAAIIGKWKELVFVGIATRRFLRDFSYSRDVLEYYKERRPTETQGIVGIYRETAERLMKLLAPDAHSLVAGDYAALTAREVELVRGTCEHMLDEEEIRLEHGMGVISSVVAIAPMLGLLGTVWGVLDAFADMGAAGTATIATMAPAISSALVTTVVGLLIAIPGIGCHCFLSSRLRELLGAVDGFLDDCLARVGQEFQADGSGA